MKMEDNLYIFQKNKMTTSNKMEDDLKKKWKTTSKKMEDDLKKIGRRPKKNGRRHKRRLLKKNGRRTNQPKST
jgi:hypothetical protein